MAIDLKRARFYMDQKRYKEATEELAKALAAEPQNATALAMLAFCVHRQNKSKEARKLAQQAVGLEPNSVYPLNILAHICYEQGDIKLAERSARDALRADPSNSFSHGMLALILGVQLKWTESLMQAEKGLVLNPHELN